MYELEKSILNNEVASFQSWEIRELWNPLWEMTLREIVDMLVVKCWGGVCCSRIDPQYRWSSTLVVLKPLESSENNSSDQYWWTSYMFYHLSKFHCFSKGFLWWTCCRCHNHHHSSHFPSHPHHRSRWQRKLKRWHRPQLQSNILLYSEFVRESIGPHWGVNSKFQNLMELSRHQRLQTISTPAEYSDLFVLDLSANHSNKIIIRS